MRTFQTAAPRDEEPDDRHEAESETQAPQVFEEFLPDEDPEHDVSADLAPGEPAQTETEGEAVG